ncbi:MAG: hypothetical protein JXB32_23685 [Deltaproteobacteria bacterium]|nr:hypothetical protein [Deltaproteobacteria bacterium]
MVLLLQVAGGDAERDGEERFRNELALLLEGLVVRAAPAPTPDFADLPLTQQLEQVRPRMEGEGAVAAMWLTPVTEDVIVLHVVALSTGRALVRLIERQAVDGAEVDLALAASDLLGSAFMFEDRLPAEAPGLQRAVERAREDAAVGEPIPWAPRFVGAAGGGLAGAEGPSILAGGLVGVGWLFLDQLWLDVSLGLLAGPLERDPAVTVSGYRVALGLEAFWGFGDGALRYGPMVRLAAERAEMSVALEDSTLVGYGWWSGRAALGFELDWWISDHVVLLLEAGLDSGFPRQKTRPETDGTPAVATPWLGWQVALGLRFPISTGES